MIVKLFFLSILIIIVSLIVCDLGIAFFSGMKNGAEKRIKHLKEKDK